MEPSATYEEALGPGISEGRHSQEARFPNWLLQSFQPWPWTLSWCTQRLVCLYSSSCWRQNVDRHPTPQSDGRR